MKRNHTYILREINGVPYILPIGQSIADHRHGIRLNKSGLFLWNTLSEVPDEESLLARFAKHYEATEEELPMLRQDVRSFLLQLSTLGILSPERPCVPDSFDAYFRIGGILIGYHGPTKLLSSEFFDFSCEAQKPNFTIRIIPSPPAYHAVGEMLIRTDDITICQNDDSYLFLYPNTNSVRECHLSIDGSHADFYCPRPFCEHITDELFHAIRFAYLVKAQQKGMFTIHSASLCHNGKAWLFSGPSGSGKSTHTNLWQKLFGTSLLNGDLNLLGYENGAPVVYGLPWCGTSGIYTPQQYPLGGIIFLKKAAENELHALAAEEAQLLCSGRMISPAWTATQSIQNLDFAARLWHDVPLLSFHCTKEDSAAHTAREIIDRLTAGTNEVSPCTTR